MVVAIETRPNSKPIAAAIAIGQTELRLLAREVAVVTTGAGRTLVATGASLGGGVDSSPRGDQDVAGPSGGGGSKVRSGNVGRSLLSTRTAGGLGVRIAGIVAFSLDDTTGGIWVV